MQELKPKRSPLFYVGDKYKLMNQLNKLFPSNINRFIDIFCGGGSASLNTKANHYVLNDANSYVIELHHLLLKHSRNTKELVDYFYNEINSYKLSHSEKSMPSELQKLKEIYKKTYFAKYNKNNYLKLRDDYNKYRNTERLYLLLVYGFNHMIRFNSKNEFNLPVGNVDWNKNVTKALLDYGEWASKNHINIYNSDFDLLLRNFSFQHGDFLYCDPPYLITSSEYNKVWSEKEELALYKLLDELHKQGIVWGLSNMLFHKGKENIILKDWANKYTIFNIKSNYISRFDNSVKKDSNEIYVTNFN
ncbi:DNA adenine methylase [[Actinobacillus] muris]|uniref:Site-specific DNA-methyltransferase (adenine-specific) n=1 Tax=Muribacter muris TaxID=67855 RepID=A0A0J5P510_9PAST|nr:Dam family site-specific DNA-(adenine-N6)-methyltransferase [Muribacter muris]KMK50770.1 DNA adenine methylase [[Actinobacillus] muris] [Muribacter muris]